MQKPATTNGHPLRGFDLDSVATNIEAAATEIETEVGDDNMQLADDLTRLKATLRACHAVFSLHDLYFPPRAGEAPMPEDEALTQLGVNITQVVNGEVEISQQKRDEMVDLLLSLAKSRLDDIRLNWQASS